MSLDAQPSRTVARRRGPVRRFLETRGLVGRPAAPNVGTRLVAADGTRLAGSFLPGPGGCDAAVLLLHGFAANRRKPAYARLADGLARHLPVLTLDLRGHGRSGGISTLGDDEAEDALAGVRWLRRFGFDRVVLVGMSMGGTAALHAAYRGAPVAGVVAVSAPAWFRDVPATVPMRRLHALWHSPLQRLALRVAVGVSLAGPQRWGPPPHPVEMVAAVDRPLLVVHGEDDAYFPVSDAQALARAAAGPAALWRMPAGFGHAEDGVTAAFADALGHAARELVSSGRFPAPHRRA